MRSALRTVGKTRFARGVTNPPESHDHAWPGHILISFPADRIALMNSPVNYTICARTRANANSGVDDSVGRGSKSNIPGDICFAVYLPIYETSQGFFSWQPKLILARHVSLKDTTSTSEDPLARGTRPLVHAAYIYFQATNKQFLRSIKPPVPPRLLPRGSRDLIPRSPVVKQFVPFERNADRSRLPRCAYTIVKSGVYA